MSDKCEDGRPRLIEGGVAVDDRGQVAFVNGFEFPGVERFYVVSNHRSGFVRAWHAHREEEKYIFVAQGAAIVGAVPIDDWKQPSKKAPINRYVLSGYRPGVLYIPSGYANGFMTLTDDALIIFYSTKRLEDSLQDDIRYDARYWDIWSVPER